MKTLQKVWVHNIKQIINIGFHLYRPHKNYIRIAYLKPSALGHILYTVRSLTNKNSRVPLAIPGKYKDIFIHSKSYVIDVCIIIEAK